MNKLIKSAMMMASVGAMLCIVGCGETNSPEKAALTAMEGLKQAFGSEAATTTFKIGKSEINGDSGVVYVEVWDKGKKEHVEKVDVKKENGKWIAK